MSCHNYTSKDELLKAAYVIQRRTNNKVVPQIPRFNESTYEMNCWGFTAIAAGWRQQEEWMDEGVMESLLEKHTKPVKGAVRVGDIVVYRNIDRCGFYENELMHTALVVSPKNNVILHKPGAWPVVIDGIDSYEGYAVSYRRIIE